MTENEIQIAQSACQVLCIEYADAVDSREYSRLRQIFAEDAVFGRPMAPNDPIRGLENIVASFEARPRDRLTQHFVNNIRIQVESPTSATGTSRMLLYLSDRAEPETPEGRKVAPRQLIGVYRDRFVRTKDGWRISERRGTTLFHT